MSEQTTTVRTDELRPGDRVWHPFDIACFTVAHKPKPETGLTFEGEPGLRVTGTNDRGETVHVDVAPAYKWHRGPKATAPTTHAPPVVNTKDGACWTRRTVTAGGIALYALADVCQCPEFVMATLPELAERGIVGSADALPMPTGPEPSPQPEAELRAKFEAQLSRADTLDRLLRTAQDRVAELEGEREKLVRWHGEDGKTITRLVARADRHRARLTALQSDALSMRGSLAPADGDRKVPFELGATLTPAVDWLIARITELEAAQGTAYRAVHDAIVMGLYRTREAAKRHCETSACESIVGDASLDWDEDEEDGVSELIVTRIDGSEYSSGYVVTPLEIADEHDAGADA